MRNTTLKSAMSKKNAFSSELNGQTSNDNFQRRYYRDVVKARWNYFTAPYCRCVNAIVRLQQAADSSGKKVKS
jgi:hypothetical protein